MEGEGQPGKAQWLGDAHGLRLPGESGHHRFKQHDMRAVGCLDRADQAGWQRLHVLAGARARRPPATGVGALQLAVEAGLREVRRFVEDLVAEHGGIAAVMTGHRLPDAGELALQVAPDVVAPEVSGRRLHHPGAVGLTPVREAGEALAVGAGRPRRSALAVPRRRPDALRERRPVGVLVHVDDHAQPGVRQQGHDSVGARQVGIHHRGAVGIAGAQGRKRSPRSVGGAVAPIIRSRTRQSGLEALPDDSQPHRREPEGREGAGVGGGEAASGIPGGR